MKNYETGIQKLVREKKTSEDKKELKEASIEAKAIASAMGKKPLSSLFGRTKK